MSQYFANNEFAMLIELRQLIDEGRFQDAIKRIAELEIPDENISLGNADHVRVLSLKGLALYKLSEFEESLHVVREALNDVKGSNDNQLIAELQSTACRCLADLGRVNEAEREYRDLIATYRRLDDVIGVIRSLNRIASIHFTKGRYPKAIDHLVEAMEYARSISNLNWQAMIAGNLGTILNLSGEFRKALDYLKESIELNRMLGDQPNLCRAYLSNAFALMHLGETSNAEFFLDSADEIAVSLDSVIDRVRLMHYRSRMAYIQHDMQAALEFANSGLELAATLSGSAAEAERIQIRRLLAEALVANDKIDEAGAIAEVNSLAASDLDERVELAASKRVLAYVAAKNGCKSESYAEFVDIVRVLDDIGARYELAITYRLWAEVTTKAHKIRECRVESERILKSLQISQGAPDSTSRSRKVSEEKSRPIGNSPAFYDVISQIDAVRESDIPVLLLGQTGVGKDRIAKYLHYNSLRSKGPFIEVNCGAIPHELAESHLFGHERGAFTNAIDTKIGMLEAATGGSLFLNEVGELPLTLQVKLLSALEEKQFYRVGGTVPRKVDFRIIAATNVDLAAAVDAGRFRPDLYFRLAVLTLEVPSLASRGDDVYLLFEYFMESQGMSLKDVDQKTLETLRACLRASEWKGNVRVLKNQVDLACVTECRDARAVCLRLISTLGPRSSASLLQAQSTIVSLVDEVEEFERSRISRALDACNGIIRRAAAQLSLPEATLRSKMKKYRISAA